MANSLSSSNMRESPSSSLHSRVVSANLSLPDYSYSDDDDDVTWKHLFRRKKVRYDTLKEPQHPRPHCIHHQFDADEQPYASNEVVTSKYTLITFLPKNLFEQFRRVANAYFLFVACIQLIPGVAPVSPLTSMLPLFFVISVTAIKQAYEDYLRHEADKEINYKVTRVLRAGRMVDILYKDITVGDVVEVCDGQDFPCDMILLTSPETSVFVTTANLDGETNLKLKKGLHALNGIRSVEELVKCGIHDITVEADSPKVDLYSFQGRVHFESVDRSEVDEEALGIHQLLLKGSRLKSTSSVIGLATFTAPDTKLVLNQQKYSCKFSTVESRVNRYLIIFFIYLVILCIVSTVLSHVWRDRNVSTAAYLLLNEVPHHHLVLHTIKELLTFLSSFNYIIPVSLYVSCELQKFIGARLIEWDSSIYCETLNRPALCNTSDLNEDLGQIQLVFADKTGTLTENCMIFKHAILTSGIMLHGESTPTETVPHLKCHQDEVTLFLLALALCHAVDIMDDEYTSFSPDEEALVRAAYSRGIIFEGRNDLGNEIVLRVAGVLKKFALLHTMTFDATRKRMSVWVKEEGTDDNGGTLYVKGADSAMFPRIIDTDGSDGISTVRIAMNDFASEGLRTLVVGYRHITTSEAKKLLSRLTAAERLLNGRDTALAKIYDEYETGLSLLGGTAVEDKLQHGVVETMVAMREAGIAIWVLTGDKQETAISVSYAAGHILPSMEVDVLNVNCSEECHNVLSTLLGIYQGQEHAYKNHDLHIDHSSNSFSENCDDFDHQRVLVVDGSSLRFAVNECRELMVEILQRVSTVICCRLSPLQKAEVVKLMKSSPSHPITLSIGDGANDVSMIQEAHVGIGIMGREGMQAVRASDYALGRFYMLKRLLLIHGRYSYVRMSTLVQYSFYKNVAWITGQVLYTFFAAWSGQTVYASPFLMFFNISFTSLPILFYGVFEKDVPVKLLLRAPSLYRGLRNNSRLSWTAFAQWLFSGLYHSCTLFFFTMLWYGNTSQSKDGHLLGLWSFSTTLYAACIIVVNLKLGLESQYWTIWNHVVLWGSILVFIPFIVVICASFSISPELYGVISNVATTGSFYLFIAIVVFACLTPDFVAKYSQLQLCPKPWQCAVAMFHEENHIDESKPLLKTENNLMTYGSSGTNY